jgi:hypothetical protein
MNASITIRNTDLAQDYYRMSKLALFHYRQGKETLHKAHKDMIKAQRELKKALNKCDIQLVL